MQGGDKKISKTIIFYGSTLAFLVGISLASCDGVFSQMSAQLVFALVLACLVSFTFFSNNKFRIALYVALFLFLGIWRFVLSIPQIDATTLAFYNGERHQISAVINSDIVRVKNRQSFVVNAKIIDEGGDVSGQIMVYAQAFPEFDYGDELSLSCELKAPEPFNGFDYGRYLAKDNIYSICYYPEIKRIGFAKANYFMAKIYAMRHRFAAVIDKGLNEPESGVARATILGEGKIIDSDLQKSFSNSGLSHIIAISGMHITVIAAMIYFILFKLGLGRNQVFYTSIVLLFLFIIMAGSLSSAMRSGIMAMLAMLAIKLGRTNNFTRIILFTAVLQLACNPRMLRDDIGFQLSFVSILGIVYIYPLFEMMLTKIKLTNIFHIRDIVSVTLAAQIATSGIIVYNFHTVSVLGIFANILVIWTSGFILIFLIIAMFLGLLIGHYEQYLFFPVKIIIDYMYFVSKLIAAIPYSHIDVQMNFFGASAYYLTVVVVASYFEIRRKAKNLIKA